MPFKFAVAGLVGALAWLGFSLPATAQNTVQTYSGTAAGDISVGTNYTPAGIPAVTDDVLFSGTTAYAGLTDTASSLTVGSLNDTDSGAVTLTIATGKTVTLGGMGDLGDNVTASAAADLLYVGTGANLTIAAGGTGGLILSTDSAGANGNFDIVGTATISAPISGTAGFKKTGAGTLTLSGANTFSGGFTGCRRNHGGTFDTIKRFDAWQGFFAEETPEQASRGAQVAVTTCVSRMVTMISWANAGAALQCGSESEIYCGCRRKRHLTRGSEPRRAAPAQPRPPLRTSVR